MDRKTVSGASSDANGGLVERLVRLADRGPEIPAEEIAAAKAVFRPEWERLVRARRRRHLLVWGGGVAAAAALILGVMLGWQEQTPPEQVIVATVSRAVGVASLSTEDGSTAAISARDGGMTVKAGSLIRTGSDARLAVQLSRGQELRIDQATTVRLDGPDTLYLVEGGLYVDSGHDGSHGLEIESAYGTATDIGTQFETRSEGALLIRVRDGAVHLLRNGEGTEVPAGFQARVDAQGSVVTEAIRPDDPVWAWIQQVAAPFDIDGQTAAAFLDWVSRETGVHVRYADPQARRQAEETILQGTLGGLTPDEAPALILPGCGLESRREGSTLVVSLPGSGSR